MGTKSRLAGLAVVSLLIWATVVTLGQTPLTILSNIRTKTDSNGYLLVTGNAYTTPETALTNFSNLRGKTDSNGYLMVTFGSSPTIPAGTSTSTATVGGVLVASTTTYTYTANATEQTAYTYSLPANTLSANQKLIRITTFGTGSATADVRQVRVKFGATTIATFSAGAGFTSRTWRVQSHVIRTAAAAELAESHYWASGNVTGGAEITTPAADTTGAVNVVVTLQSDTASAGDLVFNGIIIELLN
jgi:hypothetical protein